ncbi:unnamed protein product [Urochloa decumbens]|uniref:Uncharacterized protein n=1 Tax=Urochloa decumbens TaxID=240449 RepID=A0ABC9FHS6_9POAL
MLNLQFGSFHKSTVKAADLTARKALPFIRYDGYMDPLSHQSLKDGSIPLAQYLTKTDCLSAVPQLQGSAAALETLLDLPGELAACTERVATEDGKVFCTSLLEALWEAEQIGECFEDFDATNIYIRGRKVVLYMVKRIDLQPAQLIRNYKSAKKIIEDAFLHDGPIPEDIQHLLDMIESEHDKRSLFRIHASLWTLSNRGGMYMRMHEQLKRLPVAVKQAILRVMGQLKYIATWRSDVQTNALLNAIYTHKAGIYAVPAIVVQPLAVQLKEGTLFTDYLRNRVAHRMDKYGLYRLPFSAQGTELVALIRWPLALPTLQYELHKVRLLNDLNIGELY